MTSGDAKGWILISLVVLVAIGIALAFTSVRVQKARDIAIMQEESAYSQMAESEAMHAQIAEYEAMIHAYEAEIERLRRDRE